MKTDHIRPDRHQNPDSPRVHGLRSATNVWHDSNGINEASLSSPLNVRASDLSLTDAGAGKRKHPRKCGEHRRARGKWSVSPLWEAKILLGVLRQQGLAGKGLIEAFEEWTPRITGASRVEVSRIYREQTGCEISDYILIQQADKVVRYNQLPPEAEVVRRALVNSRSWRGLDGTTSEQLARCGKPLQAPSNSPTAYRDRLHNGTDRAAGLGSRNGPSGVVVGRARALRTRAENAAKEEETLLASKQRSHDACDPSVLLSTNEVADLTGFRPKTIRRWVSHKLLNYIRVGNRLRFRLAAVELFLGQREVRPNASPGKGTTLQPIKDRKLD